MISFKKIFITASVFLVFANTFPMEQGNIRKDELNNNNNRINEKPKLKLEFPSFNILILPDEILVEIFRQLYNVYDLACASQSLQILPMVCKRFKALATDPILLKSTWKDLYNFIFDFSVRNPNLKLNLDNFLLENDTFPKPIEIYKKLKQLHKEIFDALEKKYNDNSNKLYDDVLKTLLNFDSENILSFLANYKIFYKHKNEMFEKISYEIINEIHRNIFFLSNPDAHLNLSEQELTSIFSLQEKFLRALIPILKIFTISDRLYQDAEKYKSKSMLQFMQTCEYKPKIKIDELLQIAEYGYTIELSSLLANNRIDDIDANSANGNKLLLAAFLRGHRDMLKLLLNAGIKIDSQDESGATLLMEAAELGYYPNMISFLVEKGANIEAKNLGGKTPLMLASTNGHLEIVKALLEENADVNAYDKAGYTPLLLAVIKGHKQVVKLLIENGASERDLLERAQILLAKLMKDDNSKNKKNNNFCSVL